MNQIKNLTVLHFPVLWRGTLYFLGVVFPTVAVALKPYAEKGQWPNVIWAVWIFFFSFGSGFLTLRAYCDGSAQRHTDELKRSGDTAFLLKQQQNKTP